MRKSAAKIIYPAQSSRTREVKRLPVLGKHIAARAAPGIKPATVMKSFGRRISIYIALPASIIMQPAPIGPGKLPMIMSIVLTEPRLIDAFLASNDVSEELLVLESAALKAEILG